MFESFLKANRWKNRTSFFFDLLMLNDAGQKKNVLLPTRYLCTCQLL